MKRSFKPHEFFFDDADLATPDKLLACLSRMDPLRINATGYAFQLYQAVTNQNSFDSDEWFDVGFEIGARPQLQKFVAELGQWHQTYGVEKQFLPDILADSFLNTSWVKEDLIAAGMAPCQDLAKQPKDVHQIQASHTSLSM